MLELTKESTTTGLTKFTFTVPDENAEKMEQIVKNALALIQDDNNKLFPAREVFGNSTPGELLRGLRAREGLTQKQFGEKLGISQRHVSDYEKGIRNISVNMAKRIEEKFGTGYKVFL
jgi:DNA-binding XRE family transcriptional regulator